MIRHVTCDYVMQASIVIFVIHIYIYMERKLHIIYVYKTNKMISNDMPIYSACSFSSLSCEPGVFSTTSECWC